MIKYFYEQIRTSEGILYKKYGCDSNHYVEFPHRKTNFKNKDENIKWEYKRINSFRYGTIWKRVKI